MRDLMQRMVDRKEAVRESSEKKQSGLKSAQIKTTFPSATKEGVSTNSESIWIESLMIEHHRPQSRDELAGVSDWVLERMRKNA